MFRLPIGKLDADGMPAKKYRWLSHFERINETVTIYGTMHGPPLAGMPSLKDAVREVGASALVWKRLKKGVLVTRTFRVV